MLHSAVIDGTLAMVKYLVELGAHVNSKTTKYFTVLYNAVGKCSLEVIKYLDKQGVVEQQCFALLLLEVN